MAQNYQPKWHGTTDLQLHLHQRVNKHQQNRVRFSSGDLGTAKQDEADKMQISPAPNPQTRPNPAEPNPNPDPAPARSKPAGPERTAPTSVRRRAHSRRGERPRAGPPVRAGRRGEALLPRRRLGRRAGALPVRLRAHPGPPVPHPAARHLAARSRRRRHLTGARAASETARSRFTRGT